MTENWEFGNHMKHTGSDTENKLKSASTLSVVSLDGQTGTGSFYRTKTGILSTASLSSCDCSDFARRKVRVPCMHIYRLAIELGLMPWLKIADRIPDVGISSELVADEERRLGSLAQDKHAWGRWSLDVHLSRVQQTRQMRGYEYHIEGLCRKITTDQWIVNDYAVTTSKCQCDDFRERHLPCKHIYAAAIDFGILLPISRSFFLKYRDVV